MENAVNTIMGKDVNVLEDYKLLIGKTRIETFGMERMVIDMLMEGLTTYEIARKLTLLSNKNITNIDVERFMTRHKEIITRIEDGRMDMSITHLEAREHCERKMAELIVFTEDMMRECRRKGDYNSSIAAVNALTRAYHNYMRIRGFTSEMNQNAKNIINIISDEKMRLKDKVLSTDFKVVDAVSRPIGPITVTDTKEKPSDEIGH